MQNGSITKNGVLPVTTLIFWKFCFSLRTSYKELIYNFCTNIGTTYQSVHSHTFRNRCSFIWGCFFPVSFLNWSPHNYRNNQKMIRIALCVFLQKEVIPIPVSIFFHEILYRYSTTVLFCGCFFTSN